MHYRKVCNFKILSALSYTSWKFSFRMCPPTFNLLPTPLNVTEEKRKVVAGTNLAKCEMVNFVACPHFDNCSGEPKLSVEIPKHLTELYERSTKDLVNVEQSEKVFDLLCEMLLSSSATLQIWEELPS